MNEEAETRDVKLRVEAPKATTRSANATSRGSRARRRHANLPSDSCCRCCSCMEGIHAAILSTAIAVAQVRVDIVGIQAAMSQDFAALGDEVAGIRRHTHEHLSSAQSLIVRRFDSLQCSVIDLGLRLDRLLEKDGA